MPDNLTIDTGVKRLLINGGPTFIEFNPSDIFFAERFYKSMQVFKDKQVEYQKRADLLEIEAKKSNEPIANIPANIELVHEMCIFIRAEIDELFGEGTSQKVFGDAMVLHAFEQFFTGITPYIQTARAAKLEKYAPLPKTKRKKHVVMK
jgi:hypothetical protein